MKYFDDKQAKLILSWYKHSQTSNDEYMIFISNWICLNAICTNLYSEYANKERINIDTGKSKISQLKSRINDNNELEAEKAHIKKKKNKLEIDIKFPERLCVYMEERYTEDIIFEKFAKSYNNKIQIPSEYFSNLKSALLKRKDRAYVINMSKIKGYNEKRDRESIEALINSNIIILCEKNELSTIKNVLYQIRCNIFHGEKMPGEINDDRIVKEANPILNYIVKFLLDELGIFDS